ncbi:MAG TPA: outer membrane beta-barrel protein [Vicinamibacterales bacterium]|nr:outer membrane beta-barrel protein [Vicinamibacterales bacterium]
MKKLCLIVLLAGAVSVPAAAQPRVPDAEMWAFGGDFGVFLPTEDALDNTLDLQGFGEYYLTPRTGVRMGLGWADPSFGESDNSLRSVRLTIDVTYNWERGQTHPFAGIGLGVFFLQPKVNGNNVGESRNEAGFNLFGGLEYFTSRTVSVKGEARYQIVGSDDLVDMHGLTLSVGLKKYF